MWVRACKCKCSRKLEDGVESSAREVTWACEPPDIHAENKTQVLYKRCICSWLQSHLQSPLIPYSWLTVSLYFSSHFSFLFCFVWNKIFLPGTHWFFFLNLLVTRKQWMTMHDIFLNLTWDKWITHKEIRELHSSSISFYYLNIL